MWEEIWYLTFFEKATPQTVADSFGAIAFFDENHNERHSICQERATFVLSCFVISATKVQPD